MTLQQLRYAITVSEQHSMSRAAEKLFITQPSLSSAIKELETELGIDIFIRSNKGVVPTPTGEEFLGYARQMLEHYRLIEDRFINKSDAKEKFSVSAQHYSFAVEAFIALIKEYGFGKYEFAMHETKTGEVINNVKTMKSEIGVIYENDFNRVVLNKIFRRDELEFVPLFDCHICVFLCKDHPLAKKKKITMQELEDYPCLSFEQGDNNSFYFAEEVLSTYDYKKVLKADDRATFLNFMVGLNAYTLCCGLICEELNGDEYTVVPLDTNETMTIGYLKQQRMPFSPIAQKYVQLLEKYREKVIQ